MTRYTAGTKVAGGYYWNPKSWGFEAVEGNEGVLTGTGEYWRVPALAVIPGMLLLSFAFVVFMPFIGFAMLAWALAGGAVELGRKGARAAAANLAPAWRPGMAWFAGKAEPPKATEEPQAEAPAAAQSETQSETLSDLEQEVEARRANEEK